MMIHFFTAVFLLLSPAMARAEVVVFAAASLKEPVDALAATFGGVTVSYAGSGTLARQVASGAPADLVLLANTDWMDVLKAQAVVQTDTIADVASNRLVMIGPSNVGDVALTPAEVLSALGDGRIATGLINSVPAGIYAQQALRSLHLWDSLSSRLAQVDSVRSALTLVARGEATLGIVYETDARAVDSVRIVARFPTESHGPIRYAGALTARADGDAAAFWAYVRDDAGQAIFAQAGFLPPVAAQ